MKPIYKKLSITYGGLIKDYPAKNKAIRMFPASKRLREVRVEITSRIGHGDARAGYYYIKLQEEPNPFWNGKEWVCCWDDAIAIGMKLEMETKDPERAARLPYQLFESLFSKKTHSLVVYDSTGIIKKSHRLLCDE